MTGVRRAWRRRGIALALKQAQIDAAKAAGLRRLRTANAVQNPMLLVNERLGFRATSTGSTCAARCSTEAS